MASVIESACAWAKRTADDPNVRYSQGKRGKTIGGITYWDCSSFVCEAYKQAGVNLQHYRTSDMVKNEILTKYGFKRIYGTASPTNTSFLQAGDILVYNTNGEGHAVLYQGNGMISHASSGKKPPQEQVLNAKLYGSFTNVYRYTNGGSVALSSSNSSVSNRTIQAKLGMNPIVLNKAYFEAFVAKLRELYANDSSNLSDEQKRKNTINDAVSKKTNVWTNVMNPH